MLKLLRKARYFLKYNKKGFSLIEAIAVTTIMAILAVLIGSLLSSSTNFYNSNKEQAAAKDISKIVEKEIVKLIEGANTIYLQDSALSENPSSAGKEYDSDLPYGGIVTRYYIDVDGTAKKEPVLPELAPFNRSLEYKTLTSYVDNVSNVLVYKLKGSSPSYQPYFREVDLENNPVSSKSLYGEFKINLRFRAIKSGSGKWQNVLICADVLKGAKVVYSSTGRISSPIKMQTKVDTVFHYSNQYGDLWPKDGRYYFINKVEAEHDYSYLHFA